MNALDGILAAALGLALLALVLSPRSQTAAWLTGTSSGLAGWIKAVTAPKGGG